MIPATTLADGCILMEDAVSFLLQEGGAGRILLEGQAICAGGADVSQFYKRRMQ